MLGSIFSKFKMAIPTAKLAPPSENVCFFPLSKRGQRQRQTIHDKDTCSGRKSHGYWLNNSASRLLVTVTSETQKVNSSNEGVGTSSSEILFLWSFLSQRWAGPTVKEPVQLFPMKQQLWQQPQLPSCQAALIWDWSTWRGHAVCVVEVWGCNWQLQHDINQWESVPSKLWRVFHGATGGTTVFIWTNWKVQVSLGSMSFVNTNRYQKSFYLI